MCNSVLLYVHVIPGAIAVGSQLFGEDTLPIHISDISCSGTEQVLLNCMHNTMSGYTCSTQRDDAGAVCQGDCYQEKSELVHIFIYIYIVEVAL